MNPGGEPERDDTGLPPVDIEIPDDARELDRDVQAYRRELRAQRRTERRGRWHLSLGKDGVVLPLLACCLILALITGTLLTVFTATTSNPNLAGLPNSATSAPARSASPVAKMVGNQALPEATIAVDGAAVPVETLSRVVLVLVPAGCDCARSFQWLAEVASKAGTPLFLIYTTAANETEVKGLDSQLGSQLRWRVQLAEETDNVLSPAKVPAGIPPGQLTAILVGPGPVATWVSDIRPSDRQAPLVQVLTGKAA